MSETISQSDRLLVSLFSDTLKKISSGISNKSLKYKQEDIANFVLHEENRILYLIETEDTILAANNNDNGKLFDSLSVLTAVVKQNPELNHDIPMKQQLLILFLPIVNNEDVNQQNIKNLTLLLKYGVESYFDIMETNGNFEGFSQRTLDMTKSKIKKLVLDIQNLQSTIKIPQLISGIPTDLKSWLDQYTGENYNEVIENGKKLAEEPNFFNSIQLLVNNWIKTINGIIEHEPVSENVNEEIVFWDSKEIALSSLKEQLELPYIQFVLEILKSNNRLYAAFTLLINASLKEALKTSSLYNGFLKSININSLLSAQSFQEFTFECDNIFEQFKKIKISKYPVERAINLMKGITSEFEKKLISLISNHNLFSVEMSSFETIHATVEEELNSFENHLRSFINIARELLRKRENHFIPIKIHTPMYIKDSFLQIKNIRKLYNDFNSSILSVMSSSDIFSKTQMHVYQQLFDESQVAYESLIKLSTDDLFQQNMFFLISQKTAYLQQMESIENTLVKTVRDELLATENDPQVLFKIFEKFHFLLSKPKVRLVLHDFHAILLAETEKELSQIELQIENQNYIKHQICNLSIPPFSAKLIWIKQILHLAGKIFNHLELILTEDWANYPEGKRFSNKIFHILNEISIDDMFNVWIHHINDQITSVFLKTPILLFNDKSKTKYTININPKDLSLPNEIKCLKLMGFDVPTNILLYSEKIYVIYKYAVSIEESIRQFWRLHSSINFLNYMKILVGPIIEKLFEHLEYLSTKEWYDLFKSQELKQCIKSTENYSETINIIENFQTSVLTLSTQYFELLTLQKNIEKMFKALEICSNTREEIENSLLQIQKTLVTIYTFNLDSVEQFINHVNAKLQAILNDKCKHQLKLFIKQWISNSGFLYQQKEHQINILGFAVSIEPSLQSSQEYYEEILKSYLDNFRRHKRLSQTDYNMSSEGRYEYFDIDSVEIKSLFHDCEKVIQKKFSEIEYFFKSWEKIQILWDIDISKLNADYGDDINLWLNFLNDIESVRKIFDTVESFRYFGLIRVDYYQAQNRVYTQFDLRQKSILMSFSNILGEQIYKVDKKLADIKLSLLGVETNLSDPKSIITMLSNMKNAEIYLENNSILIENIKTGHKILDKFRFTYPPDWIYFDSLEIHKDEIRKVTKKQQEYQQLHSDLIKALLNEEFQAITKEVNIIKSKWEKQKPDENSSPKNVVLIFHNFEAAFSKIKKSCDELILASDTMGLGLFVSLDNEISELKYLKDLWNVILQQCSTIDNMKNIVWSELNTHDVKITLEAILSSSRSLDSKIRKYPALVKIQSEIKSMLRLIPFITLLKNDILDEVHWDEIFNHTLMKSAPEFPVLGDILSLNLKENEKYIKGIIAIAEEQKVLDTSIKTIESSWRLYKFESRQLDSLVLISGWETLLTKIDDDINVLESIKLSPHYSKFKNRVTAVTNNLNEINEILNIWFEAQRQWVYLLGVFKNKEEISRLMPLDSSRFENASYDMKILTMSVLKSSQVLDILNVSDVLYTVKRISEILSKVRHSLISYLEKQRGLFPRFYFIGNDDLLELVGNSTNFLIISKHIMKIFNGVSSILYNEDYKCITGIESCEGEKMMFKEQILVYTESLVDWLLKFDEMIKKTLFSLVIELYSMLDKVLFKMDSVLMVDILEKYPNQAIVIAFQLYYTSFIDNSINDGTFLSAITHIESHISILISLVKKQLEPLTRIKAENLLIELIHKMDIMNFMKAESISNLERLWFCESKFYLDDKDIANSTKVIINQGNYSTSYGFEYLGVPKKLAYTPLITSTFTLLTQALDEKLGGLLLGPAGTGKTESVKALGYNFGRMVFVFCCDETFDVDSVSRILIGVSQVGSWGCFDEFNRLNEENLSAMSTQIELIQNGLKDSQNSLVELLGQQIVIHKHTGIFITNNPNYEGRSIIPDNLKSKFLEYKMLVPDTDIITRVLLITQGFSNAHKYSELLVAFFIAMKKNCSFQRHYDFGLRTLKALVIHAGKLIREDFSSREESFDELKLLQKSCYDVILPRLTKSDELIFQNEILLFGPMFTHSSDYYKFRDTLSSLTVEKGYSVSNSWLDKCMQIYEIQSLNHGFILVGPSCSGKTTTFDIFLEVLHKISLTPNECHRLNAKVVDKSLIFGKLDYATREWKDGIFTSILRKVNENKHFKKNVWIIFDGDIDPCWVENLNSVLDDNKILTLPNGERIPVANNVKIVFEVDNIKHATPATISRCGIILFNQSYFDLLDLLRQKLIGFKNKRHLDEELFDKLFLSHNSSTAEFKEIIAAIFCDIMDANVIKIVEENAKKFSYVLNYNCIKIVNTMMDLLSVAFMKLISFVEKNLYLIRSDFTRYIKKSIMLILLWSFGAELNHADRLVFSQKLLEIDRFKIISEDITSDSLVKMEILLPNGDWNPIDSKLPQVELQPHMITNVSVVIPTIDTLTYESLIYSFLNQHRPLILCGPPGSGKTMLLLASVRASINYELVSLNFSKETTIESVVKSLEQFCKYKKSINGATLIPKSPEKWLVLFCDELNLPKVDKYGTQKIVQFLKEIITQNGFWHPKDGIWVKLQNVQFVGACNPVSISGRVNMTQRFTNYCATILIDYPSKPSLERIYNVYATTILRCAPDLIGYSEALSNSMVSVYTKYRDHFNKTDRPHYLCSPRELTRWVRGLYTVLKTSSAFTLEDLIRLWAHEALRLFSDRLIYAEEKNWIFNMVHNIAEIFFPHTDLSNAFVKPILFSDWLHLEYKSVDEKSLNKFIKQRFNVFNEEETAVNIILYEDLLDHILRVDRVLKNNQGHMILVGPSGSGKTTLTKFVSWMNGVKVFQLDVSKNFTLEDFEKILKGLLVKCGVNSEKICFIIDESTILESSFLEKMNTLLANSEVPGLFEGDDYDNLISACLKESQKNGLLLDTDDEVYQWFVQNITRNFHMVFTMSDPYTSTYKPFITSSALFNRCVVNWIGTWSDCSLRSVSKQMTQTLPIENSSYKIKAVDGNDIGLRDVINNILVAIHKSVETAIHEDVGPSQFLSLLKTFNSIFIDREERLQDLQSHVNRGLNHLKEAFLKVSKLKKILTEKGELLETENIKAKKLLDKMITDQNESERKQDMSVKMQELFFKQEQMITKRREAVVHDLSDVEILIEEAQKGVMNIKKQHLTELRSMHNPPETIKIVLESICIMLGYNVSDWRDVQHVVRQDDFIASIIKFNEKTHINTELIQYMEKKYLSRNNFNYESANRASKACGPLLMWVQAQLRFSSISVKVAPLKDELKRLEEELVDTKAKLIAINGLIKDLQKEVEKYKLQYSETIRAVENIKSEMDVVAKKMDRSINLIASLKIERERWESNILEYENQRQFLIGNTVLSASFISYCGGFLPSVRDELFTTWKDILDNNSVQYNKNLEINKFTDDSNDQSCIIWQGFGLPNDKQFLDNASIMESRFNDKFIFIIDPSASMIPFISKINNSQNKQLVISSFLDPGLVKKLENCVKFGGSILIENGEFFDPILNKLISKNIKLMGAGRKIIKIGDKEMDIAEDFKLYIHTKDPTINLHPFIKSRMTILNFTFTSETLVNEALNLGLQIKQPEIEMKRLELIKLKNENKCKLSGLEADLLSLLSSSKDNILDDDKLLTQLELIKKETTTLEQQMAEIEESMGIYNNTRDHFKSTGQLYSDVSSILTDLMKLSKIYEYSTDYLKNILETTLKTETDSAEILNTEFVRNVFKFTSISLLQKDRKYFKEKLLEKSNFQSECFEEIDINECILNSQFIILRTPKGYDSLVKIEEFSQANNIQIKKHALGAKDGCTVATQLITEESHNNVIVIIENIEMSNEFLTNIIEIIGQLKCSDCNFKLVFTCEISADLPILLIRSCQQMLIESENSIKNNMKDILLNKSSILYVFKLVHYNPKEIRRLFFILAWNFSFIISVLNNNESNKKYQLNLNDLQNGIKFIIKFIGSKYLGNESKFKLDTGMLKIIDYMITQIIFGGKLDNDLNDKLFPDKLFNIEMFKENGDYNLLYLDSKGGLLKLPSGYDMQEYGNWVKALPDPIDL